MPLINRVSRLFRADLHAVLDRIEEPDVLLRQAARRFVQHQNVPATMQDLGEHEPGAFASRKAIDTLRDAVVVEKEPPEIHSRG